MISRVCITLIGMGLVMPALAQTPALTSVHARCGRLAVDLKSAAGVQQDLIAQALDDCRAEASRLTPRTVSKVEKLAGYIAPTLALAQEGYAAKHNMDWLEKRKRQKNAGQVEFNFASEIFVTGYIGQGLLAKTYRDWKRHRLAARADIHDAVTDAVLMPR